MILCTLLLALTGCSNNAEPEATGPRRDGGTRRHEEPAAEEPAAEEPAAEEPPPRTR